MPVLLTMGFRPFFLLAGLHGVVAMVFWGVWLGVHAAGGTILGLSIDTPPYVWHAHEMLFGFVSAAIAGFLLTAVPNWTGTQPLRGGPLALLVAVWLIGRAALWSSAFLPPAVVLVADAVFLPLLAAFLAVPLVRAGKWRNLGVLALLGGIALANLLSHLGMIGVLDDGGHLGRVLAVDGVVALMVVIGGRITPAFSRNWLRSHGHADADAVMPPRPLDLAAVLATVAVFVGDAAGTPQITGVLAVVAAVATGTRLVWWKGWRVGAEPLLWVLHLGAAWITLGFALRAAALLGAGISESAALHAHTAGAVGTLVLGVMCRAALGHSGRPLTAGWPLGAAFILVGIAATVRIGGPLLLPAEYLGTMIVAAFAWIAAYSIFTAIFTPILVRPSR